MRGFDADCRIDKCRFVVESVVYLGYEISRAGVKPLRSKVETITKAPYPQNSSEMITLLAAVLNGSLAKGRRKHMMN